MTGIHAMPESTTKPADASPCPVCHGRGDNGAGEVRRLRACTACFGRGYATPAVVRRSRKSTRRPVPPEETREISE